MDNETLVDETIEIENPQNGNTEDLISEYITGNYSFKDLSSRFNKESCLYFLAFLELPNFHVNAVGRRVLGQLGTTVDNLKSLLPRFTMKLSKEVFHTRMKLTIMVHSSDFQSSKRVN